MNKTFIPEYRRLKHAGWDVSKQPAVRFNAFGESETIGHIVSKTLVAKVCLNHGYMIDTEVQHSDFGEIDVVAYAPDRINWALELETTIQDDVIQDKLERYVYSTDAIEDMQVLDVSSLPAHHTEMRDTIIAELDCI